VAPPLPAAPDAPALPALPAAPPPVPEAPVPAVAPPPVPAVPLVSPLPAPHPTAAAIAAPTINPRKRSQALMPIHVARSVDPSRIRDVSMTRARHPVPLPLGEGQERRMMGGPIDLDALIDYVKEHTPFTAGTLGRITRR
jgi:hypothetical protein